MVFPSQSYVEKRLASWVSQVREVYRGPLSLALDRTNWGQVEFAGRDVLALGKNEMRQLRREMQIVFQDPYASLNPRMTVGDIIGEPLVIHKIGTKTERRERVRSLLQRVGLNPDYTKRYPHEFSGVSGNELEWLERLP